MLKNNPGLHAFSLIALCLLILTNCKSKQEQETDFAEVSDTTLVSQVEDEGEEVEREKPHDIIEYWGAAANETRKILETFPPFASIPVLANKSIQIKDSLERVRDVQELTNPNDSLIFRPYETKAYEAILAYKQLMASGPKLQDQCPRLIDLVRTPNVEDSSYAYLPDAEKNKFLTHGNFFFLGGAPFVYKIVDEETVAYKDPQGNPETRFESYMTENGNYFLNSIYHFKTIPTNVTDGGPLRSYEEGPQEVNGIGSLIHTFSNRIPVFILTESGLVPAQIVSVTLKLVSEGLGCISDQPRIIFACAQSINERDILGIYISYNSSPVTSCTITRHNNWVWTADINNDGTADIASVSSTFEGISSDGMAEVLWFVNINGEWKIIDWGREIDCT